MLGKIFLLLAGLTFAAAPTALANDCLQESACLGDEWQCLQDFPNCFAMAPSLPAEPRNDCPSNAQCLHGIPWCVLDIERCLGGP
jgi:hypothetical protein